MIWFDKILFENVGRTTGAFIKKLTLMYTDKCIHIYCFLKNDVIFVFNHQRKTLRGLENCWLYKRSWNLSEILQRHLCII